jgi:hypothetical protein
MRTHLTVPLLVVFALASAGAQAQVYRSVDEEGNVTFSDEPPPDATAVEPVELPPGPTPEQQRRAADRAGALIDAAKDAEEDQAQRAAKAGNAAVEDAKAGVDAARAALEAAKVVREGDRVGTATGGSRLRESYLQRVEDAEAVLREAQERLKEARAQQ